MINSFLRNHILLFTLLHLCIRDSRHYKAFRAQAITEPLRVLKLFVRTTDTAKTVYIAVRCF